MMFGRGKKSDSQKLTQIQWDQIQVWHGQMVEMIKKNEAKMYEWIGEANAKIDHDRQETKVIRELNKQHHEILYGYLDGFNKLIKKITGPEPVEKDEK